MFNKKLGHKINGFIKTTKGHLLKIFLYRQYLRDIGEMKGFGKSTVYGLCPRECWRHKNAKIEPVFVLSTKQQNN